MVFTDPGLEIDHLDFGMLVTIQDALLKCTFMCFMMFMKCLAKDLLVLLSLSLYFEQIFYDAH